MTRLPLPHCPRSCLTLLPPPPSSSLRFFEEISQDTNKYVFGTKDTLACLDMGAVDTLLVWENLDCDRYELMHPGGKIEVKHLTAEQVRGVGRGWSAVARGGVRMAIRCFRFALIALISSRRIQIPSVHLAGQGH